MVPIQGLLFDKDGTLIDFHATWLGPIRDLLLDLTEGDEALAQALLEGVGYDPASRRVRADSLLATGDSWDLSAAWQPQLPGRSRDELVEKIDSHALEAAVSTAVPVLPLADFFRRLRARGLALGIATSDSEAGARTLLRREGAEDLLDFVSGYDSGHGAKSGPGMALAFSRKVGLPVENLAVVGDNLTDLLMGRAAGYGRSVGVLTGTGDHASLKVFADAVLPSIAELEDWLLAQTEAAG
ncbi:MAG: HAD family hydrolase [Rhodospirillales bacterium]